MKRYASLDFKVKTVDAQKFQIRAIFSTPVEDRQGEIVKQDGWKLDNFLRNPVVLWSHDNYSPAIGKVIDIGIIDGNLEGTIQFAANEYAFAKVIFDLYAGEYIRAISVGFSNLKWQYDEQNDQMLLLENELYEVSCVNVPANALALAKSKGVDISLIEKRMDTVASVNAGIIAPDKKVLSTEDAEPKDDDDKKEEPPKDDAGEGEDEPPKGSEEEKVAEQKLNAIVSAADAIETLSNSESPTIEAAVKVLTGRLDVAKSSQHRSSVDAPKKNSFGHINRIIRHLAKARSKN